MVILNKIFFGIRKWCSFHDIYVKTLGAMQLLHCLTLNKQSIAFSGNVRWSVKLPFLLRICRDLKLIRDTDSLQLFCCRRCPEASIWPFTLELSRVSSSIRRVPSRLSDFPTVQYSPASRVWLILAKFHC